MVAGCLTNILALAYGKEEYSLKMMIVQKKDIS